MKETTLQRIKRLNSESKYGKIEASDEWWQKACMAVMFSCDEILFCSPSELSDFQLGSAIGAYAIKWSLENKKEEQNDK